MSLKVRIDSSQILYVYCENHTYGICKYNESTSFVDVTYEKEILIVGRNPSLSVRLKDNRLGWVGRSNGLGLDEEKRSLYGYGHRNWLQTKLESIRRNRNLNRQKIYGDDPTKVVSVMRGTYRNWVEDGLWQYEVYDTSGWNLSQEFGDKISPDWIVGQKLQDGNSFRDMI